MIQDLLKILIDAGLSQGEISRRSGIPQPSINRLLNGRQHQVVYSHGKALERLVDEVRPDIYAQAQRQAEQKEAA